MKKFFTIRNASFFIVFIFFFQILQIIYFQRAHFLEKYDVSYWKDRFEHSQWILPLSQRAMGDDGLFTYVGYRLVEGEDPSKNNPETAPVGKYLLGISVKIFGSSAYYALFFGISCIVVFYFIARKLLASLYALFVTVFLLFDPLFFSQFWKGWLDIPQLFFLLLTIVLLLYIKNQWTLKTILLTFISGLSLGLFSEVKLPILLPIVLLLEVLFLFRINKRLLLFYFLGFILGFLIPYFQYFFLGHSLIDFIRLQKYIIAFYQNSQLSVHHSALWQVLFLGNFPNIVNATSTKVTEWSVIWPLLTLSSFYLIVQSIWNKNKYNNYWKAIAFFLLYGFVLYSFIPFYTRYFLLLLPFLYLYAGFWLQTKITNIYAKGFIILALCVFGCMNSFMYLNDKPDALLRNYYHSFTHQFFQDIYQENLSVISRPNLSRQQFRVLAQSTLQKAGIYHIEIKEKSRNIQPFSDKGFVTVFITYHVYDLGSFTEEKTIQLVRENNQWKIVWDWNTFLHGFTPDSTLEKTIIFGKRGSIKDKNNLLQVEDTTGYLILVNPEKIDTTRENEMLQTISRVSYQKAVHLQNAYLENALPGTFVPLATTFIPLTPEDKDLLLSYPGVLLQEFPSRIYYVLDPLSIGNLTYDEPMTRIYSTTLYQGINGIEKTHNNHLQGKSGGKLILKDKNGKIVRILIDASAKNGHDITLPL